MVDGFSTSAVSPAPPPSEGPRTGSSRSPWWWQGWLPVLVLPAAVLWLVPGTWPRWALMWTLAFALYGGCKWLTWRRTPVVGASLGRHLGYLLAWPGLDAAAFLNSAQLPLARPTAKEWWFASGKLALGVGLLFGLAREVPVSLSLLAGWIGMVGIVLTLHFGSFHLLSCSWRSLGVDARPLMNWPLLSVSVGEFWGRRWNTAFRDLTHRFLFRPLTTWVGPRWALFAGFVVSGLGHELVISVPASGGYGGPSVFFVVQGVALLVERSALGRKFGLGHSWKGWLFTVLVLLLPLNLLFHPPFVRAVMVPFLKAVGAI